MASVTILSTAPVSDRSRIWASSALPLGRNRIMIWPSGTGSPEFDATSSLTSPGIARDLAPSPASSETVRRWAWLSTCTIMTFCSVTAVSRAHRKAPITSRPTARKWNAVLPRNMAGYVSAATRLITTRTRASSRSVKPRVPRSCGSFISSFRCQCSHLRRLPLRPAHTKRGRNLCRASPDYGRRMAFPTDPWEAPF